MPIQIRPAALKYKNGQGQYQSADCLKGDTPDISGKVDKVPDAESGNFAGLDQNGNLIDSGHKPSDFLTSHQDISNKANLAVVAPAFIEGTANPAGSFVTYSDGLVYQLPNGHTAGTSWESTEKTLTDISAQLQALKTTINRILEYGVGGGGGGGGSAGVSTVEFSFASSDSNYNFTYSNENQVVLDMTWASTEDNEPTGNGTLKLTIDGIVKYSKNVAQGTLHENVTNYLKPGENTLVFQMMDAYGNKKSRTFTITIVELKVTSTFDAAVDQDGAIVFPYTPYGNMEKTMHFLVDGTQVATATVSSYGRQLTQNIPAQAHGSHTLAVYFTATLNESEVRSNTLYYDIICVDENSDDTIIASPYSASEVDQYSTINIPYRVYTPGSQTSEVSISINGVVVSTLTDIDRSQQIYSCRLDTAGTTTIAIMSGNAVKLIVITVNEVTIDATAETEGLKLYLSSYGRSNNEQDPATWSFDQNGSEIEAQFSGFNWINDGWVLDDDGITVMRVSGDARITIPYQPFASDKRNTGFTIEIDFATRDVRNYSTPILSCVDNGRGFVLTSQEFRLNSEGSGISMQFKENEHVRVAFVVEKRTSYRLIYCYINGIMSGVTRYAVNDNFQQNTPKNITIGSNDSTIDLYTIRIYDNDLPMRQIEENWIADTPNGTEMVARFSRNNIRNASDEIVINKLPSNLPYMIISCPELPQYKGDKKTCSGSYTDPLNTDRSFTFEGCTIDVQGTSSQYYARKNYKMKFGNGFIASNGALSNKYKMNPDAIAVKTFTMKADVASSEGANNVELVRLYNDICPYKTPAQVANNKVRQGIDGFPIVIFWNNPDTNNTTFLGKYNFNNDKGTEEVFGFTEGDESWEILNNTSNRVIWKSDDYTGKAWLNDFEARYPDTDPPYEDPTQLAEFAAWVRSTDPAQATNEALAESVTYPSVVTTYVEHTDPTTGAVTLEEVNTNTDVTYTNDTAEYRKAKFKNELGNYVEMQSTLFYYLFTELFLMVDSRAKNAFPSFIGTPIAVSDGGNENE